MHQQQESERPHPVITQSQSLSHLHNSELSGNLESPHAQDYSSLTSDGLPTVNTHPEDAPLSHNSTETFPTQPIIPQRSGSRSHSAVRTEASPNYSQSQNVSCLSSARRLDGVELAATEVRDLFAE